MKQTIVHSRKFRPGLCALFVNLFLEPFLYVMLYQGLFWGNDQVSGGLSTGNIADIGRERGNQES